MPAAIPVDPFHGLWHGKERCVEPERRHAQYCRDLEHGTDHAAAITTLKPQQECARDASTLGKRGLRHALLDPRHPDGTR
jgi:hypothetical protein